MLRRAARAFGPREAMARARQPRDLHRAEALAQEGKAVRLVWKRQHELPIAFDPVDSGIEHRARRMRQHIATDEPDVLLLRVLGAVYLMVMLAGSRLLARPPAGRRSSWRRTCWSTSTPAGRSPS